MRGDCDLNGGSAFSAHMGDAMDTGRGGAAAAAENQKERQTSSEVPPALTQRAGDTRTEEPGRGGAAAAAENPRERPAPFEVPPAPTQRTGDTLTEDTGQSGAASAAVVWRGGVGVRGDVARHQSILSQRVDVSKP